MKVVIDLDSHQAIQDFSVNTPAQPYQFKSQDTVEWELYFVKGGIVQDLGAGFAVKFGMIKAGDTSNTLLAYQTTFNHLTDVNGNVYYAGLVNFNTSQMATAIGTLPSILGTAEVRYQDSLSEIIHSINISTIVYATIIVETGVTPPGVSTGYPDASTIELLVHKNVANGYAGLTSGSKIYGTQIPVDGQTVKIDINGNIASAAILASVAANFVTPASGSNVTVTVDSTANLRVSSYVRIPIAGYYIVQSITDSVTVVLQNNGDPFNVASGTTITTGATILPAQAAAGGGGTPGQNAFTQTTASFTVPAPGAAVSVPVQSTAWLGGSGFYVFITGAGYYAVASITDTHNVVLTNTGSVSNSPPGSIITSGTIVAPGGPPGAAGATGTALSAYDTLAASFTMPAAAASVTITIGSTAWLATGQIIYIAGAGYFQVAAISSATQVSITNANYPGNAATGATIASGAKVSSGGLIGPAGAGGAGLNAFTTLSANYVQPAVNATVTVNVGTTAWIAIGLGIFIQGGGYYTVTSISDLTHAIITNVGGASNVTAGSTVTGNGTQTVAPAGTPGIAGVSSYTITTANFTMPAAGASVTIALQTTAFVQQNQNIFVAGAGYFSIASIIDSTHVAATNLAASGNISSGTVITSGVGVTTAGAIGPTGPTGPTGPPGGLGEAPTDGQIYGRQNSAWVVAGGGGAGGPILPSARIFEFDDFTSTITTAAQPNGKLGWNCKILASGSLASGSTQGANSTDKANGVWALTGSTTGDWASLSLGDYTGTGKPTIVPALGVFQLEWRMNIGALPSGSQDLMINFGLVFNSAAISTVGPNDGIFFTYWFGNAITNWQARTVAGGTATNTSTGTAATATGWHKFQILTNAGWTSIQFLIDGVVKATNTTNVPTANLCPFFRAGNLSGVTWASAVYVDYYHHDYQYTR